MTQTELMADNLHRNNQMVAMTLADFSDAEFFVRPVPGANHPAWQIGHLIGSLGHLVGMVNPAIISSKASEIGSKFGKGTASIDDPKQFPGRAELMDTLNQSTAEACAWIKSLSQADLDKALPDKMKDFAPTVGHLVLMLSSHIQMHIGQFQVLRRKLGKPVLF